MRKLNAMLICFSLLVLTISCGGAGSGGGDGNTAPVALISNPLDDSAFTLGDVIEFEGSCLDSEDGDIDGSSLVWTSDVDGQIGTGDTCSMDSLSAGAHQITLTVADSGGAVGMDTVVIYIAGNLPDTGQTASYTDTAGEDSDYTINPPSYTKLDDIGDELADGAADWAMVRDNVTNLVWEVKTDDGTIHDKDESYTWQDAQDIFISQLNSDNFGGYSDWRLPTVKEMSTLVQADTFEPAIDSVYFPNTVFGPTLSSYMSSDTLAFDAERLWYVHFSTGQVFYGGKAAHRSVRAVRGAKLVNRFLDNGDGTVSDAAVGLMWQLTDSGAMIWEAALNYCENLGLARHHDWRMPNRVELQSIVDYQAYSPAPVYWSSTSFAINPRLAWGVNFYQGYVSDYLKGNSYPVRCVRGGG